MAGIQKALDAYRGSAHRLECIGAVNGVRYFNDSKATNVEAVRRALECFADPVVLIMGGRDKGGDFHSLAEAVRQHVRTLIVMGEAADDISSALGGAVRTKPAPSMRDAVCSAYNAAAPGEVVLLSPGCASFDMFDSYAQRGEDFRREVARLSQTGTG